MFPLLVHVCFCCITTTTTTVLWPFFWDHPGEPVPEENFWTFWCKGRLTEADTPTIRLGATPSALTSAHLHHTPTFLQAGCPSCCPTNNYVSFIQYCAKWLAGKKEEILWNDLFFMLNVMLNLKAISWYSLHQCWHWWIDTHQVFLPARHLQCKQLPIPELTKPNIQQSNIDRDRCITTKQTRANKY